MPLHPHLARLLARHRGTQSDLLGPRVPATFEPLTAPAAEAPAAE